MRGIQQTTTFLLAITGVLSCASLTFASGEMAPEPLQASGGLTLGSAALIAIAGAVITFGKSRTQSADGTEESGFKSEINGRLCTANREEHRHDA